MILVVASTDYMSDYKELVPSLYACVYLFDPLRRTSGRDARADFLYGHDGVYHNDRLPFPAKNMLLCEIGKVFPEHNKLVYPARKKVKR